jgi:L-lactate dehydrogenase complex protein LldG
MNAIYETFKTRAEAVSAEVHRFASKTEAVDFITHYLRDAGVADAAQSYALWADCPFLAGIDKQRLEQQVPGLSFDVTREKASSTKVGISQLDWAMANTGSLIQDASAVDCRLVSTMPNIHVALIGTDRLVPDMASVFARIRPEQANYISFITGPSRTADIERVLTIGVHGPEKLIIVFVDALAEVN